MSPDPSPLSGEERKALSGNASATVTGASSPSGTNVTSAQRPTSQIDGQAKERRHAMRPVLVVLLCSCGAELPPPTQGVTRGYTGTDWWHQCRKCGAGTTDKRSSQSIVYERVRRSRRPSEGREG